MRILIVHNDYGQYSGEEAVVDRMIADFKQAGNEVAVLRRSSAKARNTLTGNIRGFFSGIYSFSGRRLMRQALHDFRPDVVNIHNLYPFISPAVLPLCRKAGVPVVMTVHNYRLICPTGLFLRDGKPCENCLRNGNERDCIRFNCEHNRFRSIGYALRNMAARCSKAYKDNVDRFCCLTEFQKTKLIAAGFDPNQITVIPNCIETVAPNRNPLPNCPTDYVGYVGRLSEEKGFDLLIEVARRHPEIPFCFAGTPRDDRQIKTPSNVHLCGYLDSKQLARFYVDARFIVIPSRCYEGFPVALLEAASHSRCCIAPNHGPFPSLICSENDNERCGLLFNPSDVDDLEIKVMQLWENKSIAEELGQRAEQNYHKYYLKTVVNAAWAKLLKEVTNEKSSH